MGHLELLGAGFFAGIGGVSGTNPTQPSPSSFRENPKLPRIHTLMWSFQFWLLLREQIDRDAYNDLFRQELERLLSRLTDPVQRQHAESMRGL